MIQVRDSVKVGAAGHAREGQAGVVQSLDGTTALVKFDADGAVEAVEAADLVWLGSN